MYLKRVCYPVRSLGPGDRVGIWLTGCERRCSGCMSPELRRMEHGQPVPVEDIVRMLHRIRGRIDGFTISGGEPFLQASELNELVGELLRFSEDIIVYSGYRLEELQEMDSASVRCVLRRIAVLIDGEYVEALNDGKGIRGSSNQCIHIFRPSEKYESLGTQPRTLQSFRYDGRILLVGIQ